MGIFVCSLPRAGVQVVCLDNFSAKAFGMTFLAHRRLLKLMKGKGLSVGLPHREGGGVATRTPTGHKNQLDTQRYHK
jgi:hypothetical protein